MKNRLNSYTGSTLSDSAQQNSRLRNSSLRDSAQSEDALRDNFGHENSEEFSIANSGSVENATSFSSAARKVNISRDEMNLSEFPLTVLSTRASSSIKTLEFNDSIRGKNGEKVNRSWIITGADKFGLPTSSDDEVLLGLLKLTVDRQFESRKVFFSRYELLKNLRWTTEGRSYSRLQKALDRLSGVRIKATNAFFDNDSKSHSTKNFGIIDGYELNDGRDNERQSFFSWSDVIFRSFQSGFIKKLDLDFYLALKSSVSKRLYRFLDKHFWYRSRIQMNFFIFAHEKIGISRTYQFVSSMKQQLDPALDELKAVGFIQDYEYQGQGKGTEIIILAASGKPRVSSGNQKSNSENLIESKLSVESSAKNSLDSGIDSGLEKPVSEQKVSELKAKLVHRGISSQQVAKLVSNQSSESLSRIEKIISHFDYLVSSNSALVSKNRIGFLYRAVQNPQKFQLPLDKQAQKNSDNRNSVKSCQTRFNFTSDYSSQSRRDAQSDKIAEIKARYLVERKLEVNRLKSEVEKELILRIRKEVELALHKLKSLISESRFQEAVEHGVEEKLAKLFAFPEFEEWSRGQGKRVMQ